MRSLEAYRLGKSKISENRRLHTELHKSERHTAADPSSASEAHAESELRAAAVYAESEPHTELHESERHTAADPSSASKAHAESELQADDVNAESEIGCLLCSTLPLACLLQLCIGVCLPPGTVVLCQGILFVHDFADNLEGIVIGSIPGLGFQKWTHCWMLVKVEVNRNAPRVAREVLQVELQHVWV